MSLIHYPDTTIALTPTNPAINGHYLEQSRELAPFKTLLFVNRLIEDPIKIVGIDRVMIDQKTAKTNLSDVPSRKPPTGKLNQVIMDLLSGQEEDLKEHSMHSQVSMIEHFQMEDDDNLAKSYITNNIDIDREQSFSKDYQLDSLVDLTEDINHSSLLIGDIENDLVDESGKITLDANI